MDETFLINGKTIHLNGVQLIPGSFGSAARLLFQMEPVDQVLGVRVTNRPFLDQPQPSLPLS